MLPALLGGRLNAVAARGGFVIFSALLLAINANSIKLNFRRPPGDRGAIRRDERHTGVGETIANNGSNQIRWFGGRVGVAQDHTAQFDDDRADAEMGDAAVRRRFGEEAWSLGRHIVVAWNSSRPAARSLNNSFSPGSAGASRRFWHSAVPTQ